MSVLDNANKGLKTIQQTCQRIDIPINSYINEARKIVQKKDYRTYSQALYALEAARNNMQREVGKHRSFRTHRPFTIQTLGSGCDQAYNKLLKAIAWFMDRACEEEEKQKQLELLQKELRFKEEYLRDRKMHKAKPYEIRILEADIRNIRFKIKRV